MLTFGDCSGKQRRGGERLGKQPPERRSARLCYRRLLDPEDFSRVHNVVGVDRLLDRTHKRIASVSPLCEAAFLVL